MAWPRGESRATSPAPGSYPLAARWSHPLAIELAVEDVTTRPADSREPNVKKGGRWFGVVAFPAFVVVTSTSSVGAVDFVVPSADQPFVTAYLNTRMH